MKKVKTIFICFILFQIVMGMHETLPEENVSLNNKEAIASDIILPKMYSETLNNMISEVFIYIDSVFKKVRSKIKDKESREEPPISNDFLKIVQVILEEEKNKLRGELMKLVMTSLQTEILSRQRTFKYQIENVDNEFFDFLIDDDESKFRKVIERYNWNYKSNKCSKNVYLGSEGNKYKVRNLPKEYYWKNINVLVSNIWTIEFIEKSTSEILMSVEVQDDDWQKLVHEKEIISFFNTSEEEILQVVSLGFINKGENVNLKEQIDKSIEFDGINSNRQNDEIFFLIPKNNSIYFKIQNLEASLFNIFEDIYVTYIENMIEHPESLLIEINKNKIIESLKNKFLNKGISRIDRYHMVKLPKSDKLIFFDYNTYSFEIENTIFENTRDQEINYNDILLYIYLKMTERVTPMTFRIKSSGKLFFALIFDEDFKNVFNNSFNENDSIHILKVKSIDFFMLAIQIVLISVRAMPLKPDELIRDLLELHQSFETNYKSPFNLIEKIPSTTINQKVEQIKFYKNLSCLVSKKIEFENARNYNHIVSLVLYKYFNEAEEKDYIEYYEKIKENLTLKLVSKLSIDEIISEFLN